MKLGADPEVFLASGKTVLSSIGRVGGTKLAPKQIPTLPTGFTVQEDNVAVEFGIPPCKTKADWVFSILTVQEHALKMIESKESDPKFPLKFAQMSCTVFPRSQLLDPASHIFGCEPDFNAWTGEENISPIPPRPEMRSAGGHIHIETELPKREVIQAMDLCVGLATLFQDRGKERRKIYGKAGAFRPKSYGVEYRVPSNYWIFNKNYISNMWDRTFRALELVESGVNLQLMSHRIQTAINTDDKDLALYLMDKYNVNMEL